MAAKYGQIAHDLAGRIEHGEFPEGSPLPPETQLMKAYDVSLGTMRRAMESLESQGWITRIHGRGTFPRLQRPVVKRDARRYQWEADRVGLNEAERRSTGATEFDTGVSTEDLDFSAQYLTLPATSTIAGLLGIKPGATILRRIYRTKFKPTGELLGRGESYIPIDIASLNPALLDSHNEPWPGGTLHQLSTVGITPTEIQDRIYARPANEDEAIEFNVSPNSLLICSTKTTRDSKGRAVEVALIAWPAQKIEMTFTTPLSNESQGN